MGSFGDRLKKEREKRGMTLEDVSNATKIGVRSLRALEQEKFELLPGGVFNKGFVRSYAKHLGLDDEAVVADYLEAAGEAAPASTLADPAEGQSGAESADSGSLESFPFRSIAVILAVAALLVAGWLYYSRRGSRESAAQNASATAESAATVSGNPARSAPAPVADPTPGGSAAEQSTNSTQESTSIGAQGPTFSATQGSVPVSATPTSAQASSGSVAGGSARSGANFELSLRAIDDVWLSITVDSQPPAEALLIQGQTKTMRASSRIVMRIGNPVVLRASVNGKPVPIRGAEGQPETLIFTASGLEPASEPSPKPN